MKLSARDMRLNPEFYSKELLTILGECDRREILITRTDECATKQTETLYKMPASELFLKARDGAAAKGGLLLMVGCWEKSHQLVQNVSSREGSYWHAIIHRMEPDASNSAYWFQRVGEHPIFSNLHSVTNQILRNTPIQAWTLKSGWDPLLFTAWCDQARTEGDGESRRIATEIQRAECEMLLEWCAGAA